MRYGRIVIEAGGEISGDMRALNKDDAVLRGASADRPASPFMLTEDPEVPAQTLIEDTPAETPAEPAVGAESDGADDDDTGKADG